MRNPAVHTLKNSAEERKGSGERGGKIYLRNSTGLNKAAMEKYRYSMHGNTNTNLKNTEKTRVNGPRYKGLHETGG